MTTDHTDHTSYSPAPDVAPPMVDDASHHHEHHHQHQDEHHQHHHTHAPDEPYHSHPIVDDPIHPGELVAALSLETQGLPVDDNAAAAAPTGRSSSKRRFGWRKASPYWVLCLHTGGAISLSMSMAPKMELYNQLACDIHFSQSPIDVSILPVQQNAQAVHNSFAPSVLGSDDNSLNRIVAIVDFGENSLTSAQQDEASEAGKERPKIDPIICRKSPAVQTISSRFVTAIGILNGITSALTTGWWTRMSDKWGRKPVLGVSVASLILGDAIFLLTAKYPSIVPGGYNFLYAGAVLSGLFGGMSTMTASKQAYIADCSLSSERSRFFAGLVGMGMAGIALGPLLGAFINRWFNGVLWVLYISLILRMIILSIILLPLPESLSAEAMEVASAAEQERSLLNEQREDEESRRAQRDGEGEGEGKRMSVWQKVGVRTGLVLKPVANRIWDILSPLEIFWPKKIVSNRKGRRDWNLTLLALGFSLTSLSSGSTNIIFQYTQLVFGWGPSEISLFLSTYGTTQAVYLLFLLPLVIRLFRSFQSPSDPSADAKSELQLILYSTVISIVSYTFLLVSKTPTMFVMIFLVSCIGEGVIPAISSLALLLVDDPTSTGKLLGAMSMLMAVLATVLGPILFGLTFAATTEIYPNAAFVLILGLLVLFFISFLMIRIRDQPRSAEDGPTTVDSGVHSDRAVDERSPLLTRDE